jgi:hypothetical protein
LATVALKGMGFLDQIKGRSDVDMVEGDKREPRSVPGDHGSKIITVVKEVQSIT